jgi:YbbR domain-containing protein
VLGFARQNRLFEHIGVDIQGGEKLATVRPHHVSVRIQATAERLQSLKTTDIHAYVDIQNLVPGRYDRDVSVKIPEGIVLISTEPKSVTVEVYNQQKIK